ncbi:MAG TPA: hypothetical protein VK689_07725 [Armatimonadota bacterium]|nr:hypothetical protein [Armatimonadota bacterium]
MAVERQYWKKVQHVYMLDDYPDVPEGTVQFPPDVPIAYAVCGKECGNSEFIVDGSTQICCYCGNPMFRTEVRMYRLESGHTG